MSREVKLAMRNKVRVSCAVMVALFGTFGVSNLWVIYGGQMDRVKDHNERRDVFPSTLETRVVEKETAKRVWWVVDIK